MSMSSVVESPHDLVAPLLEDDDGPVHIANPYADLPTTLCGEPLVGDCVEGVPEEDICRVCMRVCRAIGGIL